MSPWAGRRVIVTGGTGFIGSQMIRKLVEQQAKVTALIRPGGDRWRLSDIEEDITFMEGDLLDSEFVRKSFEDAQPGFVYNFAFPGGYPIHVQERADMLGMGLPAVHNLLHAARDVGAGRFIQIGSSTEYGLSAKPQTEKNIMDPVTIRGVGKAASTLLCRQFSSEFNFPVGILRLYAVYGPFEQPNRLIPQAIHAALTGRELPLTPPGFVHDWIYVDDVIHACLKACEPGLPPGEIVNIGSGVQRSNEEIVLKIEEVSGLTIRQVASAYPPRPFDTSNWQADISKAEALLDWTPETSLTNGLRAALAFWRENQARFEI